MPMGRGGDREDQMALTEERSITILMEETVRRRPLTPDTSEEEREYRLAIREDIRMMRAAGVEVVVPSTQPDPSD